LCQNIFSAACHNIYKGRGCPFCKNKTEQMVRQYIQDLSYNISSMNKFDWCKNFKTYQYLPFDIVILNKDTSSLIIEVDGEQHFVSRKMFGNNNYNNHHTQRQKDTFKAFCAHKQNIPIIRIVQEDVWNNTFDWQSALKEAIENNQPAYLSSDPTIYTDYKADLEQAIKEDTCMYEEESDLE